MQCARCQPVTVSTVEGDIRKQKAKNSRARGLHVVGCGFESPSPGNWDVLHDPFLATYILFSRGARVLQCTSTCNPIWMLSNVIKRARALRYRVPQGLKAQGFTYIPGKDRKPTGTVKFGGDRCRTRVQCCCHRTTRVLPCPARPRPTKSRRQKNTD